MDATIGDASAADTKIVFDGNAQDYHIGLDDSSDKLVIGNGSTLGSNSAIVVSSDGRVDIPYGIKTGTAVRVSTTHAGNAYKWIKIATVNINTGGSTANHANGVFLVRLTGLGNGTYDYGDSTFLISATFTHKGSSPWYNAQGTELHAEVFNTAHINDWLPSTHLVMTHEDQTTNQAVSILSLIHI